jgi:transposase
MRIRKVKTASGSIAVQIGCDIAHNFMVSKHFGSAKNDFELKLLLKKAQQYLYEAQLPIFKDKPESKVFISNKVKSIGYRRVYAYEKLSEYFDLIFQTAIPLFKDLVLIRIIKPLSKSKSLELIQEYFGIKYKKTDAFRQILLFDKDSITRTIKDFAVANLGFDYALIFYDITTLYFETNKGDEFRKNGFSKDNKMNQPQILVGLLVDRHGFPIDFHVFEGNKYEGHTLIPVIKHFRNMHNIPQFTVVADAGMLSKDNLAQLKELAIYYIVGGRTASISIEKAKNISEKLKRVDGKIHSITKDGQKTIYQYSSKRATKDAYDLKKLVEKAEWIVNHPGMIFKRSKFVTTAIDHTISINQELIKKHTYLVGLKSYITNLQTTNRLVIERYKDLWKVEKAFRISKSDLQARPIYHRKKEMIIAHLTIVFAALAVAKLIEFKSNESINSFVGKILQPIDFELKDEITGKKIVFRSLPY